MISCCHVKIFRRKLFQIWTILFILFIVKEHLNLHRAGLSKINKTMIQERKRRINDADCRLIIEGDKFEINAAKKLMNSEEYEREGLSDNDYVELTQDCDRFKETRGYLNYRTTPEEEAFPIAFSILLYKDVERAERLLRLLYRPQNVFCLNVDKDSSNTVKHAIRGISNCFDNVFVVSKQENVVYGGFTTLKTTINCMQDLTKLKLHWNYYINLPSTQFPIKTNNQMVQILKIYNRSNDIECQVTEKQNYKYRIEWKKSKTDRFDSSTETFILKNPPPMKGAIMNGSHYGIYSREFINFITSDIGASRLLHWVSDGYTPEETYFSTIHCNSFYNAPGSPKDIFLLPENLPFERDLSEFRFYSKQTRQWMCFRILFQFINIRGFHTKWFILEPVIGAPFMSVYVAWEDEDGEEDYEIEHAPCYGKVQRNVCVFGVEDLQTLVVQPQFFINKIELDYQPLALECMEEWYWNKTAVDHLEMFNTMFYESFYFVKKRKAISQK